MMMPPTIMIGAVTIIATPMKTTICTWVTSLVLREISVGAPNRGDLLRGESPTRCEDPGPQVAAQAIADSAPR